MHSTFSDYYEMYPGRVMSLVPDEVKEHASKIKLAREWQGLGFEIELDPKGHVVKDETKNYRFRRVRKLTALQADAHKADKKPFSHHNVLVEHIKAGCRLDEFIGVPDDAGYFCKGLVAFDLGQTREAAIYLYAAHKISPETLDYRTHYYRAALEHGELSIIVDEFQFFEKDMDCMIHSGRFDKWIEAAILAGEFSLAREIIEKTGAAIGKVCAGRSHDRVYGDQKQSWFDSKMAEFQKKRGKYIDRLDRIGQ